MAGSFNHIVDSRGKLLTPEAIHDSLDTPGDVYEAFEQMYGMIWQLANMADPVHWSPRTAVEYAEENFDNGIALSPTKTLKGR